MADTVSFATRISDNDSLGDMLKSHRSSGIAGWKPFWEEATRLQKFAGGDQWADADRKKVDNSPVKSALLTIDEIGPVLQTFGGRQIMQRFERAYMPRHPAAAREAEILTAVDRAMMEACDAEQVESAAFRDGPGVQGVSCVRWELDDLNERGGGLLLTDVPIWQMMADPEARKVNLGDRAWHRFGDWWPQSEVKARWPDKWEEVVGHIGAGGWSGSGEATESSRIPWAGMAGNKTIDARDAAYYPKGRSLWIEYEEWKEVATHYEVGKPIDPAMTYEAAKAAAMETQGETFDTVTLKSWAEVKEFKDQHLAVFGEELPKEMISPRRQVVYKYAYVCGDLVLETGDVPTGYWTFQFLTGFRYPLADKVKWRSLVSRLVDPQKWVNAMLSLLIRNLQISPKGLLIAEEGFFKNRNEAMASWSSPGGLIMVGRGKLSQSQPGYKWEGGANNSWGSMVESLLAFYREAIPRLAGFNPGALGQLGNDLRRISSGVVRQVQDAAMTANAELFDALRLHRREGGRIFLSFLRRFFEVDDIVRIVGEDVAYVDVIDPATGLPAIDPATGAPQRQLVVPAKDAWKPDYWKEIAVEDVVPTGDQLQALWKALETAIPMLLQPQPDTGMPLFSSEDLAEMVPGIPPQRREKMLQRIRAAQQRMQQQQAQQQQEPPANDDGAAPEEEVA